MLIFTIYQNYILALKKKVWKKNSMIYLIPVFTSKHLGNPGQARGPLRGENGIQELLGDQYT